MEINRIIKMKVMMVPTDIWSCSCSPLSPSKTATQTRSDVTAVGAPRALMLCRLLCDLSKLFFSLLHLTAWCTWVEDTSTVLYQCFQSYQWRDYTEDKTEKMRHSGEKFEKVSTISFDFFNSYATFLFYFIYFFLMAVLFRRWLQCV